MTSNTDELRAQVHRRWQEQVLGAFRERGWQPPRHAVSGGPVPWDEVASTAVEAIWSRVEPIVSPIVELLAAMPDMTCVGRCRRRRARPRSRCG